MRRMKTIIVDDERLARQRMHRLLAQEPDVEIVGQCKSAREARALVARGAPDLIFLDVQLPREDGFALLESVGPKARPAVVFVTAFEQYAVQAFDVMACDYLLKPVAVARLRIAVRRARELLGYRDAADAVAPAPPGRRGDSELGDQASAPPPAPPAERPLDAVLVRTDDMVLRFRLEAIDWIEAAGNYVHVHVEGKAHLLRETIAAFEAKLPPEQFARIHRTVIVNLDRIVAFHPTVSGDFSVTLRDGRELRMSRTYRPRIRDVFGRSI